MRLFDELKRRKVIRVGVAYLALSWLLLQVAETLLPAYGYTDAAIRNLVTVLAMGLVLALVLAWVFDWTPQGVQKTAAIGEGEAQRSARAPNAVIAMIVLVAAGAAAFLAYRSLAEVPRSERTIAVLPFATLGRDEADVFTDGMHLGVLTRLSEIHDLDVISRTSAMRLRGSNMSLPEIADQLGADWVLNAEVQKGNEEVLVSVRLADARMDRQVWAENYRRTLTATNLFQIQGEIARRIIDQLRAQLTEQEADRLALVPTRDLDAYRLYQLGRMKLEARSRDDMWAAVDLFGEALEHDPEYALAYAGTADALASLVAYGHESGPEILTRAGAAVDRALQLDAGLAEAWAASALLAYLFRDLPRAIGDVERAIEARPSFARAYTIRAYNYGLAGNNTLALESARRAVTLDPLSPEAVVNFASTSISVGRGEIALSEALRALEMAPGWPNTRFVHGLILFELERYRETAAELRGLSIPWIGMGAETLLALSLNALGQEADASALFRLVAGSDDPYATATLTAAFEDLDEGYRLLDALEVWPDWPTLAFIHHHEGVWNPQGNDPRYTATRLRINASWGLPPEGLP
jgi:TolB-like protein